MDFDESYLFLTNEKTSFVCKALNERAVNQSIGKALERSNELSKIAVQQPTIKLQSCHDLGFLEHT